MADQNKAAPFGYAVEQPDGHVTFFKQDPKGFRGYPHSAPDKSWADLGVKVHDLFTHAAAPAVPAVDALTRHLAQMENILREDCKWNGNDYDYAEKSETDVAMLVDLVAGCLVSVRALATPSTAPADPEQAKLDSLAQAGLAAALENRARQPHAAPTDLSKRLRDYAEGAPDSVEALMVAAADEIERHYGGMLAWQQTAEKKGCDWNEERMGRVNDRIEARLAAPEATSEQPEERTLFESWASKKCGMIGEALERRSDNGYCWGRTSDMWAAWEAAIDRQQMGGAQLAKADYNDPKLACSDCGLTMGESRLLGHIKLGIVRTTPESATERKPLTDAEILALADQCGIEPDSRALFGTGDVLTFANAIEQHHGITGGGK